MVVQFSERERKIEVKGNKERKMKLTSSLTRRIERIRRRVLLVEEEKECRRRVVAAVG